MIFSTCDGSFPLAASSWETLRVCSTVGTWPVSKSQSMASGTVYRWKGESMIGQAASLNQNILISLLTHLLALVSEVLCGW